jgi:hypothetical protein
MKFEFVELIGKVLSMTFDNNDKRIIDYIFTNVLKEGLILRSY